MKKCISLVVVLTLLMFSGCGNDSDVVDGVVSLRNKVLSSVSCSFIADVTVDYGESLYSFSANCCLDSENNMEITILEPSSIAGIKASITAESGKLTFDEQVLLFETVADGQIAPVGMPWLLMEALRGGYISMCSSQAAGVFARIDDSYKGTNFCLDLRLDNQNMPVSAEIIWEGKRIVSMTIMDFVFV